MGFNATDVYTTYYHTFGGICGGDSLFYCGPCEEEATAWAAIESVGMVSPTQVCTLDMFYSLKYQEGQCDGPDRAPYDEG